MVGVFFVCLTRVVGYLSILLRIQLTVALAIKQFSSSVHHQALSYPPQTQVALAIKQFDEFVRSLIRLQV